MHEELNSKRYLRLVTTTKASPLSLNERLVYSALLTNSDGLTQAGTSAHTGLDAKETVAASLKSLADHELAEQRRRRWVALEPKVERAKWFSPGPNGKTWQKRFAYSKLYERSPNCPLTSRQNVIFCTLVSLASKTSNKQDLPQAHRGRVCSGLTYEYIAALTGVGVKTVTKTIDILDTLGLAKSFRSTLPSRFALILLEPSDEALSWFVDKDVEVYPGLVGFMGGLEADRQDDADVDAAPAAVAEPSLEDAVRHRKAAKRAKASSEVPTPKAESKLPTEGPHHRGEPEILPPVPDHDFDQTDPIELRRLRAAEHRRLQEREIEAILLGYGYDVSVADRLSRAFDKPGLPQYDAYLTMIHDAESTFQKNKAKGRYASVRTSELLLVKWLEHHRKQATEKNERAVQTHDLMAFRQRVSLVGRTALERPWEEYEDPLTAPFDARLFVERIASSELRWNRWRQDYGEDACRRALVGLPRVRIDVVLLEDERMEPGEFEERLKAIAPPKPVPRMKTQLEMLEEMEAGLGAA